MKANFNLSAEVDRKTWDIARAIMTARGITKSIALEQALKDWIIKNKKVLFDEDKK